MSTGQDGIGWKRLAAWVALAVCAALAFWWVPRSAPGGNPSATRPSPAKPGESSLTPDERARVERAMASGRIELPAEVAALILSRKVRSNPPAPGPLFSPISPVGTAVRASRPQFTWSDAGADAHTVTVFDHGDNAVVRSARVGGTSWTSTIELARGETYRWQVTAHRGARNETEPRPPRPDARFIVLDAATVARVEEAQSRLAREPLALGILLAEAGLVSEARVDLTRALKSPGAAAAARRLLESLDAR